MKSDSLGLIWALDIFETKDDDSDHWQTTTNWQENTNPCILNIFSYSTLKKKVFERKIYRMRKESQKVRDTSSTGSLPKWLQRLQQGSSEAKSQSFQAHVGAGVQALGPSSIAFHRCITGELDWKGSSGIKPAAIWMLALQVAAYAMSHCWPLLRTKILATTKVRTMQISKSQNPVCVTLYPICFLLFHLHQ